MLDNNNETELFNIFFHFNFFNPLIHYFIYIFQSVLIICFINMHIYIIRKIFYQLPPTTLSSRRAEERFASLVE